MVREGYLAHGPGQRRRPRPRALRAGVMGARARSRRRRARARQARARHGRDHGRLATAGASAGIFHEARTQTRRFLSAFGGFIDQDSNYSFGTALKFLPHVLGSAQAVTGPLTSWSSIARHSRLVRSVRRRQPEEHAGGQGRLRRARRSAAGWRSWRAPASRSSMSARSATTDRRRRRRRWIPIRPNTDTAMLLALTHTLIAEGLHDETFLARYCDGLRARAALSDGRDATASRRTPPGPRRSPAFRPRRSARWRAAWRQRAP